MTDPQQLRAAKQALGGKLAIWRKARNLRQQDLSDELPYSRSSIAGVETGVQIVDEVFWVRCDALLQANGELVRGYRDFRRLESQYRSQRAEAARRARWTPLQGSQARTAGLSSATPEVASDDWDEALSLSQDASSNDLGGREGASRMLRRTVLTAVAVASGKLVAGESVASALGVHSVESSSAPVSIDHWVETAWEYAHAYLSVPRAGLITDLGADILAIRHELRGQHDNGKRRPLLAVAAQLAALMAMACTDVGYAREARHLWRLARRCADDSEDRGVQLWVSGHEVTLGIYQLRPLPVLLELADKALSLAGDSEPTSGKAELLAGRAQILALLGRAGEAQEALADAGRVYERLPAAVTHDTASVLGWPLHRLHHAESFAYSASGSTVSAYRAQELALELYPSGRRIGRCQVELHRARCLVRDGDISGGARHANALLESLPSAHRQQFVLVIADHVLAAVPARERRSAAVKQYSDQLWAVQRKVRE